MHTRPPPTFLFAVQSHMLTMPLADLSPTPAFEKYAEASGGHGEAVSDPAALPGAIERALRVVREEKRQALVNVRLDASYVKTS